MTPNVRGMLVGLIGSLLVCAAIAVPAWGADGPTGSPAPSPDKTSGFGTTPITDPRQDGLYVAQDRLAPLLVEYADVVGETRWSMDTQTLTVEVVDGARGAAARRDMRALDVPVTVDFAVVQYSKAELLDAADRLLETSGTWSAGLPGLSYAAADTASGSVVLGVDLRHLEEWRAALPEAEAAVPVTLRGEAATGVEFSRSPGGAAPRPSPAPAR